MAADPVLLKRRVTVAEAPGARSPDCTAIYWLPSGALLAVVPVAFDSVALPERLSSTRLIGPLIRAEPLFTKVTCSVVLLRRRLRTSLPRVTWMSVKTSAKLGAVASRWLSEDRPK